MPEQGYTNPEGIGRFSFSESGTYRSPYKNEGFFVFITLLIALIIELAVVVFAVNFMWDFIYSFDERGAENAAMFAAIATAAFIGVCSIIIIAISGTVISRIFGGMDCQYSALEDKFILTIGGDTHTINYSEVQSVVFTPRYFLGKIKGYDVDVTAANKVEHYAVTFRGQFQSEKATPFYIIKDRVELLERRRSDERALYAQQKIGADKPVSQNEIERARLRKNASNDIFPPNSRNYTNKMMTVDNNSAPTMDSIAPRSVSAPKMVGVSAQAGSKMPETPSMQMPELKTVSHKSAPASGEKSAEAVSQSFKMEEIAPINKRPSSEIFPDNSSDNAENPDSNNTENPDIPDNHENPENSAEEEQ